jgi:hypothetical protein
MLPSNRLGINDNEENEPSPGAFNITREAQHRPPITRAEPISAFSRYGCKSPFGVTNENF